ncbi:MAG TPA: NAD-dependent epimerase/dehydratase family protein, partial [Phnomibacter sp.]|nr:NAD-dependent epimerase/dehydratase family protein [Phnomibacter sp.]
QQAGAQFVEGNLLHPGFAERLVQGCDAVIHAAALSAPWGPYSQFYQANVLATQLLAQASLKAGVQRFVYISTPSIYFNYTHRLHISELEPLPRTMVNAYAATKLKAEQLVLQSALPAIALRPRAIIGRGDTVIMPRVLKAWQAGKLKQVGNGQNLASFTAVANVVQAVQCALQAPSAALGQPFNVANEQPDKLWQALQQVLTLLGHTYQPRRVPYALAYSAAGIMEAIATLTKKEPLLTRHGVGTLYYSMTLDIDRAKTLLHYQPMQSTADALQEFVHWYQNRNITEKHSL